MRNLSLQCRRTTWRSPTVDAVEAQYGGFCPYEVPCFGVPYNRILLFGVLFLESLY